MYQRKSLAFKVGLLSAVLSCFTALLILSTTLFIYQKFLKEKLISQVEINISKVNNFILGFLYAQANWIHLEENQKFLNSLPNVSYTYIQNPDHIIDFGIMGLKSPEIGLSQPVWEPQLSNQNIKSLKYCFSVPSQAVALLKERVKLGEEICVLTSPIQYNNTVYGYIRVAVNFREVSRSLYQLILIAIIISLLIGFAVAACVIISTRRYFLPIRQLSQKMNSVKLLNNFKWNTELNDLIIYQSDPEETAFLKSSLKQFLEVMTESEKLKRDSILSVIARQVAHDIRSPLAVLELIMADLEALPEEKRILTRSAVNRIHDIANNLLDSHRSIKKSSTEGDSLQLLTNLINSIVTEKRLQYRSFINIKIEADLGVDSYGIFAKINPNDFKRVLSNIIDNAVEAMSLQQCGKIIINVSTNNEEIMLNIIDNGTGIKKEILPLLFQYGHSFGKERGSGLGLYHAKMTIENFSGTLEIVSEEACGTRVFIKLPAVTPPNWFVSVLKIYPHSTVIILDDDASIHQVWQKRFEICKTLKRLHFSTPDEIKNWVENNSKENTLFLLDYELSGYTDTGLSLVASLGIAENSILVTSHSDEISIIEECQAIGVKMIPKSMVGFVPVVMH